MLVIGEKFPYIYYFYFLVHLARFKTGKQINLTKKNLEIGIYLHNLMNKTKNVGIFINTLTKSEGQNTVCSE